jgi:hypothetical protein
MSEYAQTAIVVEPPANPPNVFRRKVIARAARTALQYETTQQFLIELGLNDLSELPNIQEFPSHARHPAGSGFRMSGTRLPLPPMQCSNGGKSKKLRSHPWSLR